MAFKPLAKVLHSQWLAEKVLQPWISRDGIILSAHCSCTVGLGESCTHVAATLFMLEANTRLKEIMLQYEASEVTGDQMPDQVNVTFGTETKSLTKLNLRRSRHFNLDIPLYSLDTDQEGIFHRHKVKTRPKKTVVSSSFIDRDASYDEMNADTAIDNLQAFNIGSGSSIVGIYDHVMLLTGYDLFTLGSNNDKQSTLGIAFGETMCRTNGKSSSVIEDRQEDRYSISTSQTVAHELAHGPCI
ncbi:uncharacterized protein LOC129925651 isoform X8 [Biomphalaria glabrata]|uniref:Uncharacterized protein LOC129925651 isoform X8 n=1 Tax=Biomphalaria glabrata TaxID=6526 RepID=A0A9W3A2C9_BIOGL|nr:uncharacterized protein LOC129925651 isoform X8 [Biomphalaria glabrata]